MAKKCLTFLIRQVLVEERIQSGQRGFVVSEKGIAVLKYFREPKKALIMFVPLDLCILQNKLGREHPKSS